MNDAQRRAVVARQRVRVVKARARRGADQRRDDRRQRAIAFLELTAQQRCELAALQIFHRQVIRAGRFAEVLHVHDVRVVQLRREPSLIEKHLHELGVGRVLRQHHLHSDDFRETTWTLFAREQQVRHAAAGEGSNDLIRAERLRSVPHLKGPTAQFRREQGGRQRSQN